MAIFDKLSTILMMVDDSKVGSVVLSILDAAHADKAGVSKIFVGNIEIFDITTKEWKRHL